MDFNENNKNGDNSEDEKTSERDLTKSKRNLHALPSTTVRLLGSSQVITSVHSVVKELIENSLDAGATCVDVKLEDYGLSKIEVRDNGCGIDKNDIENVTKHYHTSKISSFQDLQILQTYGFRGEALGSLCSLSNVSVTSKTESAEVGQTVCVNNQGEIITSKPSHFGKGTCVTALNLFKNLPVRKQFYSTNKKKKEELKKVEDLVMSFAVIRPDIRVSLRHGKDLVWQKFAVLDHRTVLLNILGTATFNHMMQRVLKKKDPEMEIEAFFPKPKSKVQLTSRASNDRHLTFINKRPVLIKDADKLVRQYYTSNHSDDASSSNRYPIYFLSVILPPGELDVNVEPNKTRVILENQDILLQLLTNMLEEHYVGEGPTTTTTCSKSDSHKNNNNLQDIGSKNNGDSIENRPTTNSQPPIENEKFKLVSEEPMSRRDYDDKVNPSSDTRSVSVNISEKDQTNFNCSQDSSFGSFDLEILTPPESQVTLKEDVTIFSPEKILKDDEIKKENSTNGDYFAKEDKFSRGDNPNKGDQSANCPELSQKQLAFQELMYDLNEDDILSTFDESCGSEKTSANQSKISSFFSSDSQQRASTSSVSPSHMSADNWSRGTGLTDQNGQHIQGSTLLLPCLPSDEGSSQSVNSNGKRPPSPTSSSNTDEPPPKKPTIKTAETTMFDLICSQPIKRPQTAFIHFSKEVRPQVVQDNPDLTFQDTARFIGRMWKSLSDEEKKKYEQLCTKDVERYKQQVSASKNVPLKGKKTQMSKRSSLSIKDCLMNMMSPRPLKPGRPIKSKPSQSSVHPVVVKTVNVELDLTRLKELYSNGFGTSQSQFPSELNLIGCIKSHGSWVCCQGNQLSVINTSRIEETILHHNLMKNHVLKPDHLENPIRLDSRLINSGQCHDLYSTLVTITTERSRLIGGHYHIVDKRLTENGFDLTWTKDENTAFINIQIVGLSAAIPGYGVADLREILVTLTSADAVSQCRPFKVISYLKSEAVRIMRNSPIKTQREDVEELLEELANQIPGSCVTCLHDKPFYHQLYDLSNFTFSQTQPTQG